MAAGQTRDGSWTVEIRIYQDHLELWYGNQHFERIPRLFGRGNEAIDFRHVYNGPGFLDH
jgi:hypothetical protein